MRLPYKLIFSTILLSLPACSTFDKSVQLGGTLGAATGTAAVHAGYSRAGEKPDSEIVLTGAAVGLALGVLTSYFTHKEVEEKRYTPSDNPQTYFGDLPPNPFVIPNLNRRGGQ